MIRDWPRSMSEENAAMIRPLNILKRGNWVTPLLHWPGRARNMGRACPARVVHDVLDEAACGSAQTARLAQRTQRPSGRPRHLAPGLLDCWRYGFAVDGDIDVEQVVGRAALGLGVAGPDRKSTRLNSSH